MEFAFDDGDRASGGTAPRSARSGARSDALIGRSLRDVDMPEGCLVALVRRGRESIVPRGGTMLQAGDRLTIIGEPAGIKQLSDRYTV